MNHLILVAMALQLSCSSRSNIPNQDKLDIPLKESKANKPKDEETFNNTIEWSEFFEPPPTQEDQKKIAVEIKFLKDADNPSMVLKKARHQKALGKFKDAELTYRHILRHDPINYLASLELAQLYLKQHEEELALEQLSQTKKIFQKHENIDMTSRFIYRHTLGLVYLEQEHYRKGHRILRELIASDRKFIPAYVSMSQSYFNRGKLQAAEFIAKRGLDQNPNSAALLNILGLIAHEKSEHLQARDFFDQAIKLDGSYAPSLVNRANLAITRKEFSSAENDLNRAIKVNPNYHAAYTSLGVVMEETGRFQQAKNNFLEALTIHPEDAHARYNLAVLTATQLKDANTALRLFLEVLQTSQKNTRLNDLAIMQVESLRETRISNAR